jgi:hypothetical protein
MANNLHISYDLKEPGKNYDRVIQAVKNMGSWAKVHYSFWYVKSDFTAAEARDTAFTLWMQLTITPLGTIFRQARQSLFASAGRPELQPDNDGRRQTPPIILCAQQVGLMSAANPEGTVTVHLRYGDSALSSEKAAAKSRGTEQ